MKAADPVIPIHVMPTRRLHARGLALFLVLVLVSSPAPLQGEASHKRVGAAGSGGKCWNNRGSNDQTTIPHNPTPYPSSLPSAVIRLVLKSLPFPPTNFYLSDFTQVIDNLPLTLTQLTTGHHFNLPVDNLPPTLTHSRTLALDIISTNQLITFHQLSPTFPQKSWLLKILPPFLWNIYRLRVSIK
jgi:hypothetical protein